MHRESTQEHRLLSFDSPAEDPVTPESKKVSRQEIETVNSKVDAMLRQLQQKTGEKPSVDDPENSVQIKIVAIAKKFESDANKIKGIMDRNKDLQTKGVAALSKILTDAEESMNVVGQEAAAIVTAKNTELSQQVERYNTKKQKALTFEKKELDDRDIENAENEANLTLTKIDGLLTSIERLLPLTPDKKAFLTLRDRLFEQRVGILSDLADFQGARRNVLEGMKNAPMSAVRDRYEAASMHLTRTVTARREALGILLRDDISPETKDRLTEKKDELFDSMAKVFKEKTQKASQAHTAGVMSLDEFQTALNDEILFLDTYEKRDRSDYALGRLVNEKAESLVQAANTKPDDASRKVARAEAVKFIYTYGNRFITPAVQRELLRNMEDAKNQEATNTRNEQETKAQELLGTNPIVDLGQFLEGVATVSAQENLGQYYGREGYEELSSRIDSLVEKSAKEIESRIKNIGTDVGELFREAKTNKEVPNNFGQLLEKTGTIARDVEFYTKNLASSKRPIDRRLMAVIASSKKCFADIVQDYREAPAVRGIQNARDAETFTHAFEAVAKLTAVIEVTGVNLDELLGSTGSYSGKPALLKASLMERLRQAIASETDQGEKLALLKLEGENEEIIDPYAQGLRAERIEDLIVEEETTVPLNTARMKIVDQKTVENLNAWIIEHKKFDPSKSDTRSMKTEYYTDSRGMRCLRTVPQPSLREQVQTNLRKQLTTTIPMLVSRQDKTALSDEIAQAKASLQQELERWMTPDQMLQEATIVWVKESNAIDELISSLNDPKLDVEGLQEKIGETRLFKKFIDDDQFSVQKRLTRIPAATKGKDDFSREVDQKFSSLERALATAQEIVAEVSNLKK